DPAPLAVLKIPPQTLELPPLAVLLEPPLTLAPPPLAVLLPPPLTVAPGALMVFEIPATRPPEDEYVWELPTTRLWEPDRSSGVLAFSLYPTIRLPRPLTEAYVVPAPDWM